VPALPQRLLFGRLEVRSARLRSRRTGSGRSRRAGRGGRTGRRGRTLRRVGFFAPTAPRVAVAAVMTASPVAVAKMEAPDTELGNGGSRIQRRNRHHQHIDQRQGHACGKAPRARRPPRGRFRTGIPINRDHLLPPAVDQDGQFCMRNRLTAIGEAAGVPRGAAASGSAEKQPCIYWNTVFAGFHGRGRADHRQKFHFGGVRGLAARERGEVLSQFRTRYSRGSFE
jgi:hypothetical protein